MENFLKPAKSFGIFNFFKNITHNKRYISGQLQYPYETSENSIKMSAKRSDFTAVDDDESQENEEDDAEEEEIDPNVVEDISPKKRGRPKSTTSKVASKKTYKSNKKNITDSKDQDYIDVTTNEFNNIKKTKDIKDIKKAMSSKKSRIKSKYLKAIKLYKDLMNQSLPSNIAKLIKESKINIYKLSSLEQRACFDFFTQLSKEEIIIMFFLAANSATETAFIKEVLLDEKYVDIIFSDLQLNSIL